MMRCAQSAGHEVAQKHSGRILGCVQRYSETLLAEVQADEARAAAGGGDAEEGELTPVQRQAQQHVRLISGLLASAGLGGPLRGAAGGAGGGGGEGGEGGVEAGAVDAGTGSSQSDSGGGGGGGGGGEGGCGAEALQQAMVQLQQLQEAAEGSERVQGESRWKRAVRSTVRYKVRAALAALPRTITH
jgi:hypothetical protein